MPFIGDVGGRTCWRQGLHAARHGWMMYDSLHGKLLKLNDYSGSSSMHGAGSLMREEPFQ